MSHITRATVKIRQVDRQTLEMSVKGAAEHFKLRYNMEPNKIKDYYGKEVEVDISLIGGCLGDNWGYGLVITDARELEVVGDADMNRSAFDNITNYITDTYTAEVLRESLYNQGYDVNVQHSATGGVELVATKY